MRRNRSRFCRTVKWGGTGACGVTAVAWLLSLGFHYQWVSPDRRTFLSIYSGRVSFLRLDRSLPPAAIERGFTPAFGRLGGELVIPVWIVLLALLVPTTIAWFKCRCYPPGRCQACGYDLTGNLSGTCPECGTAVDAEAAAKDVTKQD